MDPHHNCKKHFPPSLAQIAVSSFPSIEVNGMMFLSPSCILFFFNPGSLLHDGGEDGGNACGTGADTERLSKAHPLGESLE